MSRPFESFEFLDRGWDVRVLEQVSLRRLFWYLLAEVFMLGGMTGVEIYSSVRQHHVTTSSFLFILLINGILAIRYARLIYRRLDS